MYPIPGEGVGARVEPGVDGAAAYAGVDGGRSRRSVRKKRF